MKWPEKTISEFCTTGTGTTPLRAAGNRYFGGPIPWVKSGELSNGLITGTEEGLTEEALRETNIKLVEPGAILVALYGATVGQIAELGVRATTNQAVCHIIPNPGVATKRYLLYALRNHAPIWLKQRFGGAQPNISQGIVKSTRIPLPPLSEQGRIADILDEADALRQKRAEVIRLANDLVPNVFHEMFGDPITNPRKWREDIIGNISDLQGGLQLSPTRSTHPLQLPYLRVANIDRDRLWLDEVKTIGLTENELTRTQLLKDDILVVEGHGNPDEIGRTAIWDGSIDPCVHQNHLIRVRADRKQIHPVYLNVFLNSSAGRSQLTGFGKTRTGVNTISVSNVRNTRVLIPDPKLQEQFAVVLGDVRETIERQQESASTLDNLFHSLLHRAFRGDL